MDTSNSNQVLDQSPTPNEADVETPISTARPASNIGDKLSSFSDYLSEFPHRIPGGIKSFGILGILTFGSVAGVVLIKQNADLRQQASEGNKVPPICKESDTKKLSDKNIDNSKECLLNGKTYYSCEEGYSYSNQKCVK